METVDRAEFIKGLLVIGLLAIIPAIIAFGRNTQRPITAHNFSSQPHYYMTSAGLRIRQVIQLHPAEVARVIDGDTLELSDGESVRLIGIDAPERGEVGFEEARDFVKERISKGQTVWLQSSGNDRDRFGRLRRYVRLEIPSPISDISEQRSQNLLNQMLLDYGYAVIWGN